MAGKARPFRRRWSEDIKRRVVAEAAAPGASAPASIITAVTSICSGTPACLHMSKNLLCQNKHAP